MAAQATVGLMLWDGESRGTLLNVLRLVAQGKPVVVYNQGCETLVVTATDAGDASSPRKREPIRTSASCVDDFRRDGKTVDAVVRNLEIIGIASRPRSLRCPT
jgi:hypothetical protein